MKLGERLYINQAEYKVVDIWDSPSRVCVESVQLNDDGEPTRIFSNESGIRKLQCATVAELPYEAYKALWNCYSDGVCDGSPVVCNGISYKPINENWFEEMDSNGSWNIAFGGAFKSFPKGHYRISVERVG